MQQKSIQPKPKKCRVCKTDFIPWKSLQVVCSPKCALEKAKETTSKKSKQVAKVEKAVLKDKLKTLTQYEAEAKKEFQKWVRLRDSGKPCISCSNENPADWCGSHYFPAGIYSGLIFDERNCNGACNTYCNKYHSGNIIGYRKGLIERYGVDFVEKLETDAAVLKNYKWTKPELIAKKLQYEIKYKELLKTK